MKLRCIGRYANDARNLRFEPGQVFEPDPDIEAYLRADAPGCFEPVTEVAAKAPKKPAADKAIHEAAVK